MMSRQIIFGRHAKSSWADPGQPDFDRPLNERGKKDSPLMAQRLSNAGVTPQAILASAAVRARQTAHAFAQQFKIEEQLFPSLYHAAPDAYLDVLRSLSPDVQVVAVFGHNPGMSYIGELIPPGNIHHVPTCGLMLAEGSWDDWSELDWSMLKLKAFLTPKDHGNE
ncbi:MAG: histidine phosphatase family protein [Saprospiraceae bacterium]|jgi:phosphohistidine phosphatase|nr:histidine phosphatase family protein [Saprospiraceae bacterium]